MHQKIHVVQTDCDLTESVYMNIAYDQNYFSHAHSLLSFEQYEVSEATESIAELQREIQKLELTVDEREKLTQFF